MTAPVSPQPLVARFDQRSGEMMVYGGGFAGFLILTMAIARLDFAFLAISLLLFATAYHFWPFVKRNHRALVASSAGLEIDGLGTLRWEAIAAARTVDKAVRTIRNSELVLDLKMPLETALTQPPTGGLSRRLMVQIWRMKQDQLSVRLEPLDISPEEILASVQAYLDQK